MAKKSKPKTTKKSSTKPFAILMLGIGAALAIAVLLSQGADELETSPVASDTPVAIPTTSGVRGAENAVLKLVEFGDYQCPACKAYHEIVTELFQRHPSDVQLEFHHFPLVGIHPNALTAAVAAEAAREQGRFWEMHDLLFENQDTWAPSSNPEALFMSYAAGLGLNQDQFMRSMRDTEVESRVLEDVVRGRELAIASVPSFFVDGFPIDLPPGVEGFERLVYRALEDR